MDAKLRVEVKDLLGISIAMPSFPLSNCDIIQGKKCSAAITIKTGCWFTNIPDDHIRISISRGQPRGIGGYRSPSSGEYC